MRAESVPGAVRGSPSIMKFHFQEHNIFLVVALLSFPFPPTPRLQPHALLSFVFFLGRVWNVKDVLSLQDFSLGLCMQQKWHLWSANCSFFAEDISASNGVVWCQDMLTFREKCEQERPSLGEVTCLLAMTADGSRAAGAGVGLSVTQSLSQALSRRQFMVGSCS